MTSCAFLDRYAANATCGPVFEQVPAPLPGAFDFSRVRGMMLGLAIGDALGNTSEGMNPSQRRAAHGEIRDYLPNWHLHTQGIDQQQLGLPSDDTQLAFWTLEPQLMWYVGLSGLLHGCLVAGVIGGIRERRLEERLLLAGLVLKLAYEQAAGPLPGSEGGAGGNVLVNAHLYGAIAGALAGAWLCFRKAPAAAI